MMNKAVGTTLVATAVFLTVACGSGEGRALPATPVSGPDAGFSGADYVPPEFLEEGLVPVKAGSVDANGARLYYEVFGGGEPLLLIPEMGMSHLGRVDEVQVYAGEFKVIVYDPRGTGRSSLPGGVEVTMALMADDAAAVLDALGVDSAHIYGISMGAGIAEEVALQHPEKVRSLVLGSATLDGPHSIPAEWALAAVYSAAAQGATASDLLESLFSAGYLADQRSQVTEAHLRFPNYPETSSDVTTAQMGAWAFHGTCERLPSIVAPTLLIGGADDPFTPAEHSRILAKRIPGAELVLLEGARHGYQVEKAAETNVAVLEFLRAH